MNALKNNKNIFLSFLVEPQYRIGRLIFICLMGAVVTFNMTFIAYQDCVNILGNRIYFICLSVFVLYGSSMFLNYYYLIPSFLLKGKYTSYSITLLVVVFLLPTLFTAQEYLIRNAWNLPHRITSYINPLILIDNLATCFMTLICFLAIAAAALYRQWINRQQHILQMEGEHLQSEINKLKGQITPDFLSRTLVSASTLVKTEPQKASQILMQVGQLLRYQLYDCNRDRVLFKSELTFLENFLRTEQLNREEFHYELETDGDFNNVFISPLLFISIIQSQLENNAHLRIYFALHDKVLLFRCAGNNFSYNEEDIYSVKRRLELQYPGKYTFSSEKDRIELTINREEWKR